MIRKRHWHVKNKWSRHLGLIGNRRLARHIPPTGLLSRRTLDTYLKRYRVVYIKPVFGSFGNNIMRVSRSGRRYVIRREQTSRTVRANRVSRVVFRYARSREYLIQRGIQLLHIGGRPVDYRVMMLRPGREWRFMGIMGKVASGTRIVTNFNHGGRAIQFRESLRRAGYSNRQMNRIFAEMRRIGFMASRQFSRRHKNCRRMGIDLAVDTNKRVWIIEVNTNPFYELFRHHEDRTLYRRIDRTMKQIKKEQLDRW